MKSRFDSLKYSVKSIDNKKPLEQQFPGFFNHPLYPGFPEEQAKALYFVFPYVVYLLDPNSDLRQEFETDLEKRKLAAATEAKFPKDKNGEYLEYYKNIIEFKNEEVIKIILHFLKLVNDNLYRELMTKQISLDRLIARQMRLSLEDEPDYNKMDKADQYREKLEIDIRKKLLQLKGDYDELEGPVRQMFITPENVIDAIPEIKEYVQENKRGYY